MTQTFVVEEVSSQVEDVKDNYGVKKRYRIHLMPVDGTTPLMDIKWHRMPSSPAPVKGQQIEGEVKGDRFFAAQQSPQGSSGSRGGGGRSYEADPKKQKAIAMEASQKVAADIVGLALEHLDYKPGSVGELTQNVKQVAAALYGQIEEVSK